MEPRLAQDLFRRQYGQLVATLTRVAGLQNLELAEDAVQSAFATALEEWTRGLPDDSGSWLYRVAHNRLMGDLRQKATRLRVLEHAGGDQAVEVDHPSPPYFGGELRDDLLRMLFVCCHDAIPMESRLVLALKTLCGFGTAEIALRLFTTEANVHKRLARARARLREIAPELETPAPADLRSRLAGVHAVLYLLFNEGYLPANGDEAIRKDLCEVLTVNYKHPAASITSPHSFLG